MRFFFHFNKSATQRAGKPQITVHIKNTCYIVDNVVCKVPTEGRPRKGRPRFVMAGRANSFAVKGGVMFLR